MLALKFRICMHIILRTLMSINYFRLCLFCSHQGNSLILYSRTLFWILETFSLTSLHSPFQPRNVIAIRTHYLILFALANIAYPQRTAKLKNSFIVICVTRWRWCRFLSIHIGQVENLLRWAFFVPLHACRFLLLHVLYMQMKYCVGLSAKKVANIT